MTRQDNTVPSPLVNLTKYWTQNQMDYISGFLQKMKSKMGRSLPEEITALKAKNGGITS